MFKMIRDRRLHWSLLLGVLSALGVGIYAVEQPEPMCVIDSGHANPPSFIAGGQHLAALRDWPDGTTRPLRIWDTRSGAEAAQYLDETDLVVASTFSEDRRWFAAEVTRGDPENWSGWHGLVIVHFDTGESREVPLTDTAWQSPLHLSAAGEILVRIRKGDRNGDPSTLAFYETASGRLLEQKPAVAYLPFAGEEICYSPATKAKNASVVVWSARERKTTAVLEGFDINNRGADGVRWCAVKEKDGEGIRTGILWNARTHAIDAEFSDQPDANVLFRSANGRWLAFLSGDGFGSLLEVRDARTGRTAGRTPTDAFGYWFSPDGRFLLAHDFAGEATPLRMFEPATMNILWERSVMPESCYNVMFSRDSRTFFALSTISNGTISDEMCAYDCATGAVRGRLEFPVSFVNSKPKMQITPERELLLVHQREGPRWRGTWIDKYPWLSRLLRRDKNDTTVVLDTDSRRQLLRLQGWSVQWALLSDDGHTLVTLHVHPDDRRILRCWDVNACKPLRWPIAIPASLAALCVLFTWCRNRRRPMAKNVAGG